MQNDLLLLPQPDQITGMSQPMSYVFVGDSAFPLKTFMLKPYPGICTYLIESKRIFNYTFQVQDNLLKTPSGFYLPSFKY